MNFCEELENIKIPESTDGESRQVETFVELPNFICGRCNKVMKYWDGCVNGPYGVDIENCEDPQYKCECGNKVYLDFDK